MLGYYAVPYLCTTKQLAIGEYIYIYMMRGPSLLQLLLFCISGFLAVAVELALFGLSGSVFFVQLTV